MPKKRAAILGATGNVGQMFLALLQNHPYFEPAVLFASERSAGRRYGDVIEEVGWYPHIAPEREFLDRNVLFPDPEILRSQEADLYFSALDSATAKELEPVAADMSPVFSNASAYRMVENVPLIVPEINPEDLDLIIAQQQNGRRGYIVTNPNCSTIGLVLPLKPIHDRYGLEAVNVFSIQALSGAGREGYTAMEMHNNRKGEIQGEEEKIQTEPRKIMHLSKSVEISADCNRDMVRDGHTLSVQIRTQNQTDLDELSKLLQEFNPLARYGLHSSPPRLIYVLDRSPEPARDLYRGGGMSVSVGRLREDGLSYFNLKFKTLSHNTVRGAAGASILNAELAQQKGYLR